MDNFPSHISTVSSNNSSYNMHGTGSVLVPTGKWQTSNPCRRPECKDQLYSDTALKTFDSVIRLVERQCAVEPSDVRARKSEKQFFEKVEVLKRKLATQNRNSNVTSIDCEYSDVNSKRETTNDSHRERKINLIRKPLNGKLHQSKVKQHEIKALSLLNKNGNDPSNQHLVRQNKVAVLGGLLQQVVQNDRITAADLGIEIEIQVLVLESLLQEAVQELNYLNFRGYHNKDSKRTVAVLRGLLNLQTKPKPHIKPKLSNSYQRKVDRGKNPSLESGTGSLSTLKGEECSGHEARVYVRRSLIKQAIREHNDEYRKLHPDSSKPRRRLKSCESGLDCAINKDDKITVLTGLLQLAILEFNMHDGSEVPSPCPDQLNKQSAVFPCRETKYSYRSVPNYSEFGNVLKCRKQSAVFPCRETKYSYRNVPNYSEFGNILKCNKQSAVFPCRETKFSYRNVPNYSEFGNILKCKSEYNRPCNESDFYEEFCKGFKLRPDPSSWPVGYTEQDKCGKLIDLCPNAASVNLGPTKVMDPCKYERFLSNNDGDENSKFNVEIKKSIQDLYPKNLEYEDLQSVPVKLYSKKPHLADNCTQTSLECMPCSQNHECSRSDEKKCSSSSHVAGLFPGSSEVHMCHRHKKEIEDSVLIAKK